MPQFDYGNVNPFAAVQQGIDFSQGMIDKQAQRQAGNLLAQTASPAAQPLFQSGQLDQGAKVQQYGQDQQKQAIADHLTFLTKAAGALSQIPDDGTQTARRQALSQHILPALQQMGASPQDLQQLQQTDLSDQSLNMFQQAAKLQIEKLGNDLVGVNPTSGAARVLYKGESDTAAKHDWKEVTNPDGSTSFIDLNAPPKAASPATAASPAAAATDQPRGLRNNNPLNLQPLAQGQWAGQTGTDGRYATFATPEAGMAAADKNLQSYAKNHGIDTVSGIVTRWSPPSENNTAAYIQTVAHDLGVDPNAKLDLGNPQVRQAVLQSMSKVELGQGSAPAQTPASAAPGADTGRIAGSAPGTKELKGATADEAALSPEAVKLLAGKYLANGQLPPMGMGKAAAANRTLILNEATAQAKALGLDANDLIAGTASVKATGAALSKMTAMRSQISASENTVLKNADFALTLAPKGGGPTGVPVLNRWIQAGRKNIAGDADVAAFNSALGTVADEYAKVMTSNTGSGATTSDSARQEAYRRLNTAMSQSQLQSVIGAMKVEMANRVDSLNEVEGKLRSDLRNGAGNQAPPSASPAPGAAPLASGQGWKVVRVH